MALAGASATKKPGLYQQRGGPFVSRESSTHGGSIFAGLAVRTHEPNKVGVALGALVVVGVIYFERCLSASPPTRLRTQHVVFY